MQTISDNEAKAQFGTLLDELAKGRKPITITRDGRGAAVLLDAEEYASIQETLHLLSTTANSDRIRQGLADFIAKRTQPGELCD